MRTTPNKSALLIAGVIIGIFTSFSANAAAAGEITSDTVAAALVNPHGGQWEQLIREESDSIRIRSILVSFIQDSVALDRIRLRAPAALVRERALAELGKFSVDNNGKLAPELLILYQSLLRQESARERIALFNSLANAQNYEAALLLGQALGKSEYPSSLDTLAIELIGRVFEDESKHDPAFRSDFWLQAGKSLEERLRTIAQLHSPKGHEEIVLAKSLASLRFFLDGGKREAAHEPVLESSSFAATDSAHELSELDAHQIPTFEAASERSLSQESAIRSSESGNTSHSHWWIAFGAFVLLTAIGLKLSDRVSIVSTPSRRKLH
jgi:hypothetical protein